MWLSGGVPLLSVRKRLAITAFVESLNSCFKDGLNGTQDYRAMAGVILFALPLFALLVLIIEFLIDDQYNMNILYCFIVSLLSLCVSYGKPFKSKVANMSISFYFIVFGLANIVAYLWYNQLSVSTLALEVTFAVIGISVQIPVVVWAMYKCVCCALKRVSSSSSSIL